jgi:hypothetical protein
MGMGIGSHLRVMIGCFPFMHLLRRLARVFVKISQNYAIGAWNMEIRLGRMPVLAESLAIANSLGLSPR